MRFFDAMLWAKTPSLAPAQQAISSPESNQPLVFLFVQRSEAHAKHSSSEVFLDVVNDLVEYLKSKNVALAADKSGRPNHAEGLTPMETVFSLARDADASSVLYVVVDRPLTRWIKVTVQCMDMNGKVLWGEDVLSKGATASGGFRFVIKNLHSRLDDRLGMQGLPLATEAKATVSPTGKE